MRAILRATKLRWNSIPRHEAFGYSVTLLGIILMLLGITYGAIICFVVVLAVAALEARVSVIRRKHEEMDKELKDMLRW